MTDESSSTATLLTDNTIYDSEVQPTMDLDAEYMNNVDLSDIMDFHPDLFTKAIYHLAEPQQQHQPVNNPANPAIARANNEH